LKKIVLFTILCLLINGFINPAKELTDLDKERLKGSVKSVMEMKYILAGNTKDAAKEKIVFQKYTEYDPFGYETGNTIYQDGAVYIVSTYLFGKDGKQVEKNEYSDDGTLNLHVLYKYDEKGNRPEAIYTWGRDRRVADICHNTDYYNEVIQNDLFTKVLYQYEYRGFCTEEKYIKPDSSLSFILSSRYDPRGNLIQFSYHHGNERLSWLTKYTYDRYDNMIESRVFKSNRIVVLSTFKYQFDDIGNWISRKEERQVDVNILTEGLELNNSVTERIIEYY